MFFWELFLILCTLVTLVLVSQELVSASSIFKALRLINGPVDYLIGKSDYLGVSSFVLRFYAFIGLSEPIFFNDYTFYVFYGTNGKHFEVVCLLFYILCELVVDKREVSHILEPFVWQVNLEMTLFFTKVFLSLIEGRVFRPEEAYGN